ncbi:MAG: helix-turn-helix domain-containing protein [Zoogloeaceae bacterium]|nr:helix-turn-helix domain-containing protein [Zoogloeaceae bacterium]
MNIALKNRKEVEAAWKVLYVALGFSSPVQDEAHYLRLSEFAESLADALPDDASEPLWGLVALITERTNEFEARAHPMPNLEPCEVLRELMAEWGLKQRDLSEVGSQSVVSEILGGKRELNLRQVKALAKRFNVSPDVFI